MNKSTIVDLFRDARAGGREALNDLSNPKVLVLLLIGFTAFMCILWYTGAKIEQSAVPVRAVVHREIYRESGELFFFAFIDSAKNEYKVDSRLVAKDIRIGDTATLYFRRIARNGHKSSTVDSVRKYE